MCKQLTVKWRWTDINFADTGDSLVYLLEASSHLPETRRRRQKCRSTNWLVPLKCTNLDSRAVDDSAVRTIAHHGSTKATGWISLAQHPDFPRDQRKSLLSKGHPGRSRTRSSFSWLSFSQRVNRVLCTGVGVVIVYLQYCVGGTWLKCIK
jgi:hypothetical protein